MKTKILGFILLALVVIFPFKQAYLMDAMPSAFGVVCFLATLIGGFAAMMLIFKEDKKETSAK